MTLPPFTNHRPGRPRVHFGLHAAAVLTIAAATTACTAEPTAPISAPSASAPVVSVSPAPASTPTAAPTAATATPTPPTNQPSASPTPTPTPTRTPTPTPTPTPTVAELPTRTRLLLLNPFDGQRPAAGIRVTDTVTATCQDSVTDFGNPDAYRCFSADGGIVDPCFPYPDSSTRLLCLDSPDATRAVRVTTQDLPAPTERGPEADDDPWAVEIDGAGVCTLLSGATTTVQNLRMNYGCTHGNGYGSPGRTTSLWTIYYQPTGSRELEQRAVLRAWR